MCGGSSHRSVADDRMRATIASKIHDIAAIVCHHITNTSLNHTSIQKMPVESYQYQTQTQSMAHIERHGNKIGENCTTSHALKLD